MFATQLNRPAAPAKKQVRGYTRSPKRKMWIVGALVVLVGGGQPGWVLAESSDAEAGQSTARFVTPAEHVEHSLLAQPKVAPAAPAASKAVSPPAVAPPLTVDDYQHYIKRKPTAPKPESKTAAAPVPAPAVTKAPAPAARKQLDAITDVRLAQQPGSASAAKAPKELVLAAPSTAKQESQRQEPQRIVISIPPKSQLATTSPAAGATKSERSDADSQATGRSSLVLVPARVADARADESRAKEARAEQARAEERARAEQQVRAEQALAEQARAEKVRTELARAEAARAEQARIAEQVRVEKARAEEQAQAEQKARAEQALAEQARAEKARQELAQAEAARAEQARVAEQARIEKARAEAQARAEQQARAAQALAEQARVEKARAEQVRIAEEARIAEQARITEQARVEKARAEEQARIAERARVAEQARLAEQAQVEKARAEQQARDEQLARAAEYEVAAKIYKATGKTSVGVTMPAVVEPKLTDMLIIDTRPKHDVADAPPKSMLRIATISKTNSDTSNNAERHDDTVAQAGEPGKQLPAPSDPGAKMMLDREQLMPGQPAPDPLTPLTNNSYLPANPESACFRCGVKCPDCGCNPGGPGWAAARPIPWEIFAQGEYIGPARLAHVPVYRLRVDDQLAFVYRLSGQVSGQPYRLNVRDRIQVQSMTVPDVVNREVIVQPDGTVTLPLLGQVHAAGSTLEELSTQLDDKFKNASIKDPRITVTPLDMNSNLQELRSSVDRRYGAGGQVSDARISPDGTVQLPAIGSVPAQGMTLEELEREVKARYAQIVSGLEVTPILTARAPRYVFVVGEVRLPGRYSMEGPTTLMQAISMAGSWNVGAGLNQVIVFRRDENWQLMATSVNIRESLLFKKPCPSGEIWLRDSDVVLIPKSPILCADDFINLAFTRGIYGVFPMNATLNFAKISSL